MRERRSERRSLPLQEGHKGRGRGRLLPRLRQQKGSGASREAVGSGASMQAESSDASTTATILVTHVTSTATSASTTASLPAQ